MSTIKTKIQKELVLVFLEKHFQKEILNIIPIIGGEISQAFSFEKERRLTLLELINFVLDLRKINMPLKIFIILIFQYLGY